MIVTFSCSNMVFVYEPKCGYIPRFPFMVHGDIDSAIKYLESCGMENIKIKTYKSYGKN